MFLYIAFSNVRNVPYKSNLGKYTSMWSCKIRDSNDRFWKMFVLLKRQIPPEDLAISQQQPSLVSKDP